MATFEITVTPRASKTTLISSEGNKLKVRLKAPPVDNAANDELIRFLSEHFDIPKSRICIIRGHNSRKKLVNIV